MLALVVVLISLGLAPQLFAVAQDQEFARVAGLNVRFYNLLVAVLAAVSVTVAMRTVGLLLVSALMVVPVATAQQVTRSFRTTLFLAMAAGHWRLAGRARDLGVCVGHATVATGPTIVLLSLAGFLLTWPVGALLRRRQRMLTPFPAGRRTARGEQRGASPYSRRELRPPGRSARRPRRLRPRRSPARAPREAL